MKQIFMGLVVLAMGVIVFHDIPIGGFVQIILGAGLTSLGVWKVTHR